MPIRRPLCPLLLAFALAADCLGSSACSRQDVAIRSLALLDTGDRVVANTSVGIGLEIANPRGRHLQFRWSASVGQFNTRTTTVPSNIYKAPQAAGVDTITVEVSGGTEPLARSMQLTVVGLPADLPVADAPAPVHTSPQKSSSARSLNERLTTAAWDAFNAGRHEDAIASATKCIDEFSSRADSEQAALTRGNVPLPPTGSVSEAEKAVILARGLLNDVATCFVILGRSAQALKRTDAARDAYAAAMRYPHGRCFDPANTVFWSPADDARDRLARLKQP